MPFSRPSLATIIERKISDIGNRVTGAGTFLRRSFFQIMAYVQGAGDHLMYEYLNYIKDQLFISTADSEHLQRHGTEYGMTQESGVKASGSVTVSGTEGMSISAGTEFVSSDGLRYVSTAAATIASGGTVTVSVLASAVGDAYNQEAGTVLDFVSPLSGIDSDVTVTDDGIAAGEDLETDEEYRARLLKRKRFPPHGGIANDYVNWALEYTGVTRAWAVPMYYGPGTVGLAFVMDGETDIFPSEAMRNLVRDYIVSHNDPFLGKDVGIPVTAEPGFFVIDNAALTMDMTIGISPNTSALQTAAEAKLQDMINHFAGAQETITISHIYEAVMSTIGIDKCRVVYPTSDQTATAAQVHVLGTVTWQEYSG